jgi:type IV pilus assembly protein PilP
MVPALPPDLPAVLPPEIDPAEAPPPGSAASGVRDPFRPFTLDLQPKKTAEDEFLTPLQRYDLQQLTVVGVLLDLEPPRAMLQDDAGMGYIVTPGTLIGRQSGVVTDVQPRRVIVEETYVDYYGREQVRRAVLEMSEEEDVAKKSRNK